jgi:hypothetical protein
LAGSSALKLAMARKAVHKHGVEVIGQHREDQAQERQRQLPG